jgi:two-component system, NarL family, sensor histidine kinase UhpB
MSENPGLSTPAPRSEGSPRPGRPLQTILVTNAFLVVVVAIVVALVEPHLSGEAGSAGVIAILGACLGATLLVNIALLRGASRCLARLTAAMDSAHKGELQQRVAITTSDQGLRRLSLSFNEMCARLEVESRQYAETLLSSIEEERRRIGRELHDQTSQTLAATLVNLDLADKALATGESKAARERVARSKELIGHSMEEIKLLVYDLRPVMLDDFGLAPTLRWYLQSHLRDAGPIIVTDFDGAGLRPPSDVETALYRITQELLTNAVRHADASKIVVRLETRPGYADLAVIDNGHGFDPDAVLHDSGRRGIGLMSIRERVELVGGVLNIESTIGRGTRVYVVIPFEQSRSEEASA